MRTALLLALLVAGGVVWAQGLPEPKGGQAVYVVKPGDTLWDITQRFYDNPLLWPRLWELNPYIDDPNRIFPGDLITLKRPVATAQAPQLPVVKLTPAPRQRSVEAPPALPPVFYLSTGGREGFVSPDEWEHMGTILSSEPPKILLGEGDRIYINVGSADGVRPGDEFTIFRTSKQLHHPHTGRKVGYKVAVIGEARVETVLGKRLSAAVITESYREITRGARVRPREAFVKEVIMKGGTQRVDGVVIDSMHGVEFSGMGDVIYVDLGSEDGLRPGTVLSVYKYPRSAYDPDIDDTVTIPGAYLGRVIALDVGTEFATCFVLESNRQIEKGDVVAVDLEL